MAIFAAQQTLRWAPEPAKREGPPGFGLRSDLKFKRAPHHTPTVRVCVSSFPLKIQTPSVSERASEMRPTRGGKKFPMHSRTRQTRFFRVYFISDRAAAEKIACAHAASQRAFWVYMYIYAFLFDRLGTIFLCHCGRRETNWAAAARAATLSFAWVLYIFASVGKERMRGFQSFWLIKSEKVFGVFVCTAARCALWESADLAALFELGLQKVLFCKSIKLSRYMRGEE